MLMNPSLRDAYEPQSMWCLWTPVYVMLMNPSLRDAYEPQSMWCLWNPVYVMLMNPSLRDDCFCFNLSFKRAHFICELLEVHNYRCNLFICYQNIVKIRMNRDYVRLTFLNLKQLQDVPGDIRRATSKNTQSSKWFTRQTRRPHPPESFINRTGVGNLNSPNFKTLGNVLNLLLRALSGVSDFCWT